MVKFFVNEPLFYFKWVFTSFLEIYIYIIYNRTWGCGESTRNSQIYEIHNKEKKMRQRKESHKTIFTWFDNLSTSTEVQWFHYSLGKIQDVVVQFSLSWIRYVVFSILPTEYYAIAAVSVSRWAKRN